MSTGVGAGAVQDLSYAYDPASNITAIGDGLDGARSQSFTYGAFSRLIAARGLYGDIAYAYDANGNRLSRRITGGGTATDETYAYEAGSNRLSFVSDGGALRELGMDAAGNIVSDLRPDGAALGLSYNEAGRLTQVTRNGQPSLLT